MNILVQFCFLNLIVHCNSSKDLISQPALHTEEASESAVSSYLNKTTSKLERLLATYVS
uniref:Uncharacterized protein n=1 Tax=Anguilla anguilla TaxID=7936 RepID=A0A0E9VZE4_ANGAN